MFNENDIEKINNYLKQFFPQILNFSFDGKILLIGGSIKNILTNQKVRDLDFTLLTNNKGNVLEFIKTHNFKYQKNKYRGYKILYNDLKIDITSINDLFDAGHLNTDFLFYDINKKEFIPLGIKKAIEDKIIHDYYYQGYYIPTKRIKKSKIFIQYMNNNNQKIKVKYHYCKILKILKGIFKRISKRNINEKNNKQNR